MGKYLPVIVPVVLALFILIFGYIYIQSGKKTSSVNVPAFSNNPSEVPKALPDQNRIVNLESSISTLENQLNTLKASISSASPQTQSSASTDYRIKLLETSVLELKARVAALEKPLPTSTPVSSKSPLYIPLGGASESNDQNWLSMTTYAVILDPAEYPGISGVTLEINMKLNQVSGTGYARLYNATDNTAITSEISTISDKYNILASPSFSLASGKKTYQLQLKSSTGTVIAVQNARLKVSF